jgi:hypothetical protein
MSRLQLELAELRRQRDSLQSSVSDVTSKLTETEKELGVTNSRYTLHTFRVDEACN